MSSPIQHEPAKVAKRSAPASHSVNVAAKASDVQSARQVGVDIIITLKSGEQIVLPNAGLRALTDPQFKLHFQDQDVLASSLLSPGSELGVNEAAPMAAANPGVVAPAEPVQAASPDAPVPAQSVASEPAQPVASASVPPPAAPETPIAQDPSAQTLQAAAPQPVPPEAKDEHGFALLPWLLGGGLLAGLAAGGGSSSGGGGGGGGGGLIGTIPSVTQVAISGATGIQNHTLNAGDELSISVTLSEAVTLSGAATALNSPSPHMQASAGANTSGVPTLTLNIGGTLVQASYAAGSGSNTLLFHYTVQPGQNDNNGISIDANSLSLNGATLTNAAGNAAVITHAGLAHNAAYLVDTTAPSLTVALSDSALIIGDSPQVTITFSEPVINFDSNAVSVQNGKLSPLTSSDQIHWTGNFTPNAGVEASSNLITVAASYTDAAGNTGSAGGSANYSVETTAPASMGVRMSNNALHVGQTSMLWITFSEPIANFDNLDVTVQNGSLDKLISGDHINWSATFTPTPGVDSANNVITVAANFTDIAGNKGVGSASQNYSVNTVVTPPTGTLTISGLSDSSVAENMAYTSTTPSASGAVGVISYTLQGVDAARFAVASDGVVRMAAQDYEAPADVGKDNIYNYTLKATDANGSVATQAVAVTVSNVNEAPTLATPIVDQTATQGTAFSYTFAANAFADVDAGDTLGYSATLANGAALPAWLHFDAASRSFSGTPANAGTINVKVTATDVGGLMVNDSFAIAVTGTTPPTLTISDNQSVMVTDANRATPVLYTFAFSEDVTGFDSTRVTVNGASKGSFTTVDGHTYTLAVTADDDSITNLSVTVNHTGVIDRWQNELAASVTNASQTADTRNPTATIATSNSDGVVSTLDQTVNYTLGFSEAIATLTAADLTISGGGPATGVNLASDGLSATFSVTANNNSTTSLAVSVKNSVHDLNDNALVAVTNSLAVDTVAPHVVSILMPGATIKTGDVAEVRFTFSEAVNFAVTGVLVPNGTLDALTTDDNKTWYAFLTPNDNVQSNAAVLTVQPSFTDIAGNLGIDYSRNYRADTLAPTVAITMDKATLHASETALVTFAFSEVVHGLTTGDLYAANGEMSNPVIDASAGVAGTVWTATFTPSANIVAASNVIQLRDGSVFDAAGNSNTLTTSSPNYSIDTRVPDFVAPFVTFGSVNKAQFAIGEISQAVIIFSEAVSNFSNADVTVDSGTLGTLVSSDNKVWTATFTPNADTQASSNVLHIASSYTDSSANANVGTSFTGDIYIVDTKRPTVSITLADTALKIGDTGVAVTFGFSEAVTGFSNSDLDLTVANGTLSDVASYDGGITYTANFTPYLPTESSSNVITLKTGMVADHVGNLNSGDTASENYAIDTKAPTLHITSNGVSTLKAGETAPITFTFSEALLAGSFTESSVTLGNGTLQVGSFAVDPMNSLVYTATFVPTANLASGNASITVAAGAYQDAAGNNGIVATTPVISIDTKAPTLNSIAPSGTINTLANRTITFTFSENPGTSFATADDVTITGGGSLVDVGGSGTTRTAIYTPALNYTGNVTFAVGAGSFTDPFGNLNTAPLSQTFAVDTVAPTVFVSTPTTALKSDQTATINFTFSEDPGSSFVSSDITAVNGTMGTVTGSGLTRSAVFTPTTGKDAGTLASISVTGNYTDSFSNVGAAGSLATTLNIDTKAPTLVITPGASPLLAGQTSLITFTFSEDVGTSFIASDITTTGGSLAGLTVDLTNPKLYTATFTPTADANAGPGNISVAIGNFQDIAGNNNLVAASMAPLPYDTKAPTLAITNTYASGSTAIKIGATSTITFTFSETPTGFVWDSANPLAPTNDIVVTNGTLGALNGSGLTRTATFTPTPGLDAPTMASITVIGGSYTDAAGNPGGAGTTPTINIDTLAPIGVSGIVFSGIDNIISSTEAADAAGFTISGIKASDATVSLTGQTVNNTDATHWNVTLPTATISGYTEGSRTLTFVSTDAVGNTTNTGQVIVKDTVAPTVAITSSLAQLKTGEAATITFTFTEDPGSSFLASDLLITNTGTATGTLGDISGSGLTRTAIYTPPANATGSFTVTLGATTFTDAAGNNNTGSSTRTVNFDTIAPNPPVITFATVNAGTGDGYVYFTFAEPVTGFNLSSVGLNDPSLGSLNYWYVQSTTSYRVYWQPAANIPTGTAIFTVAAGAYKDAYGNPGLVDATPYSTHVDTVPPATPVIHYSGDDNAYINATEVAAGPFILSGSKASDVTRMTWTADSGVTPQDVTSMTATTWSQTVSPSAYVAPWTQGSHTTYLVSYDAAGNRTTTTVTLIKDTVAPTTVSITAPADLIATPTPTIIFNFSEDTGASFDAHSVTINDGIVGSTAYLDTFTSSANGLTHSAVFHPDTSQPTHSATLTVATNSYSDLAANPNSNAMSLTLADPTHSVFSPTATALALDQGGFGIKAGVTVYDANATGTGGAVDTGITYTLTGGDDVGLFSINSLGAVSFKSLTTYASANDVGANHVYNFVVHAVDNNNPANTVDQAVALTLETPTTKPTIPVYLDAACTQSMGQLRTPATVDAGSTFYFWDRDNNASPSAADVFSHDTLNQIFKYDSTGNLNPDIANTGTTDAYRYATLYTTGGQALQVALPTVGANANLGGSSTGTASPSQGTGSTAANYYGYHDLLAVWDAYNGTDWSSGSSAYYPWGSLAFLSATPAVVRANYPGEHMSFETNAYIQNTTPDSGVQVTGPSFIFVILQVL